MLNRLMCRQFICEGGETFSRIVYVSSPELVRLSEDPIFVFLVSVYNGDKGAVPADFSVFRNATQE